jgi:GntR family transcriptional regulator, rspAB operon transcriptional repressor
MRTEFHNAVALPRDFTFDRRMPASQQVYEDLRAKIVSLRLKPGESLSRPNLAVSYGLSQTPVRDAFLKLQQEGLVEIYPQSRTMVARIDVDQAREAQFLRTSIEIEAVRALTLDPDKRKLAPAQQILSQQRLAFLELGNLASFSLLDRSFHLSLCTAAGHPELWELVVRRSGHIDRLRNLNLPDPGKAAAILADHAEILQAAMSSSVAEAEQAVRKHLSGTLNAADLIRERHPQYF